MKEKRKINNKKEKEIQQSNKVKKVTFKHVATPNEDDVEIGANENDTLS